MSQLQKQQVSARLASSVDADESDPLLSRELSQIAFNRRVLAQAEDESLPLLERLRCLSIMRLLEKSTTPALCITSLSIQETTLSGGFSIITTTSSLRATAALALSLASLVFDY